MEFLKVFFSQQSLNDFEEMLKLNNAENSLKSFSEKSFLQGSLLLMFGVFAVLFFEFEIEFIVFLLPVLAIPFFLNYFIQAFKFETRKRKIEALIPDLLLQASMLPFKESFFETINYLSKCGYGFLSIEFEKARKEIEGSASVEEALKNIAKRCMSKVVSRAMRLLIQGYNSGADMSSVFKETAEDLLKTNALMQERNAALIVEKYTLLFAGGLIVPMVLGLIVGMVSGFDFSVAGELSFGLNAEARKEIFQTALFANQVYLAIYALMASLFVANQEGNLKKAFLYALVLLPLSIAVYNFAQVL